MSLLAHLRRVLGNPDRTKGFTLPPGVSAGDGLIVRNAPRVTVARDAHIRIGNHVVLNSNPAGYHMGMPFPVTLLADRPGANIIIGDESRLHGCCIHAWREVRVGRKCLVAAGVNVIDSNGHSTELRLARIRDRTPDTPNPVVIGDHCWLGYGALVLKGVTLGEGCIVAAYSVVRTGSYPPFSLVAGNPARVVASLDAGEVLPESLTDEELHSLGVKPRRFRAGAP